MAEERVVALVVPAAVDAAVIVVADADEGLGIGHRQVMEQDGVDQRKDGRVGADAKRERQQHGNGEPRRLAQLAECITQILQQNSHRITSTHVDLHRQKANRAHRNSALAYKKVLKQTYTKMFVVVNEIEHRLDPLRQNSSGIRFAARSSASTIAEYPERSGLLFG